MSKLSSKAVIEFQELLRLKRGVVITYDEVEEMAIDFLSFFKAVYEPIKEKKDEL